MERHLLKLTRNRVIGVRLFPKRALHLSLRTISARNLHNGFLVHREKYPAIFKFMIVPEGEDEKSVEVYICYLNEGNTYRTEKYLFDRKLWALNSEAEEKVLTTLAEDEKYQMTNYSLFGELNLDMGLPDVPIAVKSKFRPYKNVLSNIPKAITHIGGENTDAELADIILGIKKDSYNRESFTDSAQFKNSDSIYTIYRNGLLDYRYIPGGNSEKGSEDAALMNAYKFLDGIRQVNDTKGVLYLSAADSSKVGKYVFKFDYLINESPVFFNESLDKGATSIQNAITIEANDKRVLKCTWMLRDLSLESVEK